ncbi:MAG: membrane protein insertase YidC [Cryobacterium sp.]|nr:membrane protein insertase YidC [Oligoflexia bacterium]
MDRKTLIAIGLSLIVFVGWQKFYIEPRMPKPTAVETTTMTAGGSSGTNSTNTATSSGALSGSVQAISQKEIIAKSTEISTGTGPAFIGDAGRFFTDWKLTAYKREMKKDAPTIDMVEVTQNNGGEGEFAFDLPDLAYASNVQGTMKASEGGAIWNYEDANLKLTREYSYGADKKWVDLVLTAEFKTKKPNYAFVSVGAKAPLEDHEANDRQLLAYQGTSLERLHLKDVKPVQDLPGVTKWIAAQSRYFLLALIPADPAPRALAQALPGEKNAKISLVYPVTGNTIRIPLKAYFGPKEMNTLHAVEHSLDLTIDFGWFTFFAYPILKVMKWINSAIGNWGISIILLTLLIKLITFPLTYKSMKSMKKIAALQPQMNALKEKHKDDKESLNREMITFMKTQGYNPVAGCLPIVIQMPVFFALYRVLYSSIELYQAPFFGWIQDLSLKDPFYITPVLLTGMMWLQQKVTPSTATDPMQAKMLQFMPLFFGVMMINLPAGLTIYMLVNAAASIAQQKYLNKRLA